MYSQIFSIIFKSGDYASLPQRLLRFYLYFFFFTVWALWTDVLSSMDKQFLPSTYQTTTGHNFLSRMSICTWTNNVAFNYSQSSNIINTTISPHQTYLPFSARTNKMQVVLCPLFVKCKRDCLYWAQSDFCWKMLCFSSCCLLFGLFILDSRFFDSLPEPPFSFSLTFYILPNAIPFAQFSCWKSLFCTCLALQ